MTEPQNAKKITEIIEEREQKVVKSNILTRYGRYDLTLQQQKIVLYMISKIKPTDDDRLEYITIDIPNFCDVCGIEYNRQMYKNVIEALDYLSVKKFKIIKDNKTLLSFSWVGNYEIELRKEVLRLYLDALLKKHLIGLRKNFAEYELSNVLAMKSKHSIRLFEVLCSYKSLGCCELSLDYLREMLGIKDKYSDYVNLRRRVLEPAIEEINRLSYLTVYYKPKRSGHSVAQIFFRIDEKLTLEERLKAEIERKQLDNIYYKYSKKRPKEEPVKENEQLNLLDII